MRNTHEQNWQSYSDAWSNPDETKRKEILSQLLTIGCVYTDPNIQTIGVDSLSDYMGEFQKGFPGAKFVITNFIVHHDQSLTHWDMVSGEGAILSKGASFGFNEGGKLAKMTGFFWNA